MIDNEDAAGWNLRIANHVFLVADWERPNSFRHNGVSKQVLVGASESYFVHQSRG